MNGNHTATANYNQETPNSGFPEEIRDLVVGAKLLSRVSYPDLSVDLTALVNSGYHDARMQSGFAVWEAVHARIEATGQRLWSMSN